MFIEKLDAIMLHKFLKEHIDETVKSVDIRPRKIGDFGDKKVGIIYTQTTQGLEANFILYNDKTFCISVSNHSNSKLLKNLTSEDITVLWQEFLSKTFGNKYKNYLAQTKNI